MLSRRRLLAASGLAALALGVDGCGLLPRRPPSQDASTGPVGAATATLPPDLRHRYAGQAPVATPRSDHALAQDKVATPRVSMTVTSAGPIPALTGDVARSLRLPGAEAAEPNARFVPPEGRELFLASLDVTGAEFPPGGEPPVVSLAVADERPQPLDLGDWDKTSRAYANPVQILVVTAPPEAPITLEVADLGLTYRYDLRATRPVQDADTARLAGAAEWQGVVASPKTASWKGGWSDGRTTEEITVEAKFDDTLYLNDWAPGRGWAPKGKRWLMLFLSPTLSTKYLTPMPLNLHDDVSLTANGQRYHPETAKKKVDALTWATGYASLWFAFAVPEDFTKGEFELRFPATLRVKYSDGQRRTWPNTGASRSLHASVRVKR